jgi:two-component system cell cycle sensor histidine kinase/response regulator CckA
VSLDGVPFVCLRDGRRPDREASCCYRDPMSSSASGGKEGPTRVAFESARLRLAHLRQSSEETRSQIFAHLVKISATALGASRVSVWMLDAGRDALECVEIHALAGDAYDRGTRLEAKDYPTYFREIQVRRALVASDAMHDVATRELAGTYLAVRGITSLLDAPIIREGEVIGVVCHEHIGPRRVWSEADIAFSASVADIATTMIEQAARMDLEARHRHDAGKRHLQTKMQALGRMAGSVVHDFNNVLGVVGLLAHGLSRHADPSVVGPARDILESVEVARRLTQQLRGFGRGEAAPPRRTDLRALLEDFRPVLTTAMGQHVALSIRVTASPADVLVDPSELEQIALNLCTNASEASEASGGHVDVRVRDPIASDELDDADRYLVLEVSDDGRGMDEETQERIFEPYFTTRSEGTGLGLATVYTIVEKLDGFLRVASEPGKGTTFSLALPRAR